MFPPILPVPKQPQEPPPKHDCAVDGHVWDVLKDPCDHGWEYGLIGEAAECAECRRVMHFWHGRVVSAGGRRPGFRAVQAERAQCPIWARWMAQGGPPGNVP